MNDETTKALQELASKLGTTVTYLWHVLIHQAMIAGIRNLVFYILIIIFDIIVYRANKKAVSDNEKYHDKPTMLALWIGVSLMLSLFLLLTLNDTISELFNPEYWALNEILKNV